MRDEIVAAVREWVDREVLPAGGMNTVMRTIGGALGGQLSATFVAAHLAANGEPLVTGFTETFVMATAFMVFCTLSALLIPGRRQVAAPASTPAFEEA